MKTDNPTLEFSIRPCPGGDADLERLLGALKSDLEKSVDRRSEITSTDIKIAGGKPVPGNLLVGDPKEVLREVGSSESAFPAILILPDGNWDDNVRKVCSHRRISVECILRGDRLGLGSQKTADPSEIGRMQETVLAILRRRLRVELAEGLISKPVDWKARLLKGEGEKAGFVSFFADPDMRDLLDRLKDAVRGLDGYVSRHRAELESLRACNTSLDQAELNDLLRGKYSTKIAAKIPSVLILGETGVGKSLIASWITENLLGKCEQNTYHHCNISAVSQDMIEAYLFGYKEGAFTDADKDNLGLFLSNRGKVVFLDEIGDMNPDHQVRLLTFLDTGEVRPMGWTAEALPAPLIVVAATNQPIREWAAKGKDRFRADLFHRFQYVVEVPPLRKRSSDRRLMISLLLQNPMINPESPNRRVKRISLDAIERLERENFPGNVRQLESVLRDGVSRAIAEGNSVLCLRHLTRL